MSEELEIEAPAEAPVTPPAPTNQKLTWILAGVASVAVLLAGIFGVKAFSKDDNASVNTLNAAANGASSGGPTMIRMGNAGKITKIDGDSFTLQSQGFQGETETVKVSTDDDTTYSDTVEGSASDLAVGKSIIATGTTTDGVFTAERISPADFSQRRMNGNGTPPNIQNGQAPPGGFRQAGPGGQDGSFASGEITKIEGDTITVKDNLTSTEKTIKVASTTKVMVTKTIKFSDLKVGDNVRVNGETKDSVVQAESVTRGDLPAGGLFRGGPVTQESGSAS